MMEADGEELLRTLAAGGSIDHTSWPDLLTLITSRIEKITHNEFHIPQLPPPKTTGPGTTEKFVSPLPSSPVEPPSEASSQETNKENALPGSSSTAKPSSPVPAPPLPPGTLPPQIKDMLKEIIGALSQHDTYPPHTIQRLAELVLTPRQHYRSLITYLHALDRVVRVTSGSHIYPLPPAIPDMSTMSLLNGSQSSAASSGTSTPWTSASDEALGGALLTPIPWLQNVAPTVQRRHGTPSSTGSQSATQTSGSGSSSASELEGEVRTESTEIIDGPNGAGSIETVSVSVNGVASMGARGVGVTQGELLRQEQRAGVVPVSQLARTNAGSPPVAGEDNVSSVHQLSEEEEKPHARGPEEIGAEDMGPQRESSTSFVGGPGVEMQGINLEAAVGRKAVETDDERETSPQPDKDKMDIDADAAGGDKETARSEHVPSTPPKREAEGEPDTASVSKKLKEEVDEEIKDGAAVVSAEPGVEKVKSEDTNKDNEDETEAATTDA